MHEFYTAVLKAGGVTLAGVGSIFLATMPTDPGQIDMYLKALREFGSFALVVAFVGGCIWGAQKLIPKTLEFVSTFLTTTRDEFLNELKSERTMRESNMNAFREMLQSHKGDLGGKLDDVKTEITKGNVLVEDLVKALKTRPCQK